MLTLLISGWWDLGWFTVFLFYSSVFLEIQKVIIITIVASNWWGPLIKKWNQSLPCIWAELVAGTEQEDSTEGLYLNFCAHPLGIPRQLHCEEAPGERSPDEIVPQIPGVPTILEAPHVRARPCKRGRARPTPQLNFQVTTAPWASPGRSITDLSGLTTRIS